MIKRNMKITSFVLNYIVVKKMKCYGLVKKIGENILPKLVMTWYPVGRKKKKVRQKNYLLGWNKY